MAVAKPRTLSGGPEAIRGPGRRSAWRHRLPALSRVDGWLLGAIGVLALAALSLALRSDATVFLKPFSEDGYYSLAVARSMAAGHGMTIDGVTRTNGIQPLLTIIQAGLFWLARGNDLLALRLVLILYWLLYLGTGALLGWIAAMALPDPEGRATRALTTTLIYLGASYLFLHHFNGLETGLLLFLLAAAWRYRQAGAAESWPGLALFGALLGLAVLARIDASFLVVCLALAELWRWRRRSPVRGLARGALLGAMALLVSAPWWAYNILVFGSPMPISGTATQSWAIDGFRFSWFLWGLVMGAFPWLFGGEAEGTLLNIIRLPLYAGGLWRFPVPYLNRVFVEAFFDGAVHNGSLEDSPGMNALGCNPLFHVGGSVGYELSERWSLVGTFDHLSNGRRVFGTDCNRNVGVNSYGLRVGYRF